MQTMDVSLVEAGLKLSQDLADFYGVKRPTVLSQRDVPGMTRSLIPVLKKYGIKVCLGEGTLAGDLGQGVSVGVNSGTLPPSVPRVFKWVDTDSGWVADSEGRRDPPQASTSLPPGTPSDVCLACPHCG